MDKETYSWIKYEAVRRSGRYNMILEAGQAAKEAKLTLQEYTNILKRYSILKDAIEKRYTQEEINKFVNDAEDVIEFRMKRKK